MPEAFPSQRRFTQPVNVTLVPAAPDTTIYYTLDGSQPTADSATYHDPITVEADTTIKMFAVREGERPSPVQAATFTKVDTLPRITGPEKLPVAKAGQPYEVQFDTNLEGDVVWDVEGQNILGFKASDRAGNATRPVKPGHGPHLKLTFNEKTGRLTGTPPADAAGHYLLQVVVAPGDDELAALKTYILSVEE